MFFTAVLPAFFYLIFGATIDAKDASIGNGNVAMYVMISMAAYGAVTATTSIGGNAAVERQQGWGRQLGLTPLADSSYIAMKALIAMTVAAVPVLLTFTLGVATGAQGSAQAWALSACSSSAARRSSRSTACSSARPSAPRPRSARRQARSSSSPFSATSSSRCRVRCCPSRS